MLYVILAGSILASIYELKQLGKKRYVREIVISSILLSIGAILILLQLVHIEVPSPLQVILFIFRPVSQWVAVMLS
ncbi:hypothetical protein C2I18_03510 [Paenibacillus sp. PK3_47]|nr:hypothetical protein C2I18_03510 [Paenibacillus sp. PK3_47]